MVRNAHLLCPYAKCHLVKRNAFVQALCLKADDVQSPTIACAEKPVFGADVTLSSAVEIPGVMKINEMTELGWVEHTLSNKLFITGERELSAVFDVSTLAIKNQKPLVLVNCMNDISHVPLLCFYLADTEN